MKIDYSPTNNGQNMMLRRIIHHCKESVDFITRCINNCPGLFEKGFLIEMSIDPEWDTIGKQIKISRKVISDGEIKNETYYIQRGFGENDEGWKPLSVLCSNEFVRLLDGEEDKE